MKRTSRVTILVTGGHLTPAFSLIEEIRFRKKKWDVLFIGRKHTFEKDNRVSQEYRVIAAMGIPFLAVNTGRLSRDISLITLFSLLRIPIGFVQALWYVGRYRPDLIVSFGGYVAVPVVFAGFLLGVPSVTHEQTTVLGLANKLISRVAKRVFTSYPHVASIVPKGKGVCTGIVLRRVLFTPPEKPSFTADLTVPVLYVTGGTTGAVSVNELIFPIVSRLVKKYTVVHQTGNISYAKALRTRALLPQSEKVRYISARYFDSKDTAWVYRNAACVIGRSGANTVGEVASLGKVALFLPLPWSADREQEENARFLEEAGSARVIDQTKTSPTALLSAIDELMAKRGIYEKRARRLSRQFPHDGATRLVEEIEAIVTS